MPNYPADYKETEAREFNPETNSGIKLIQGGSKKNNASMSNQLNPANMIPIQPVVLTGVIEEIQ